MNELPAPHAIACVGIVLSDRDFFSALSPIIPVATVSSVAIGIGSLIRARHPG